LSSGEEDFNLRARGGRNRGGGIRAERGGSECGNAKAPLIDGVGSEDTKDHGSG